MERLPRGRQGGDQADAHAAVLIAFSDGLRPDVAQVEREPVIRVSWQQGGGDSGDEVTDWPDLVGGRESREVDIGGWPAQIVGGKEHAALETNLSRCGEAARRSRKPSRAYRRRYSAVARPAELASPRKARNAWPDPGRLGRPVQGPSRRSLGILNVLCIS